MLKTKKLYAVYLGGRAEKCQIELHDVVFVVGSSIEETYFLLPEKWFGNLNHFHIDSYICLEQIDGYDIHLTKEPLEQSNSKKLYFINLGAYKPLEFTEYHQSAFYIAENAPEATQRAKSELCQDKDLEVVHKDDVITVEKANHLAVDYDVDDLIEIKQVDEYNILLTPAVEKKECLPVSKYIKLDMLPGFYIA